VLGAWLGGLFLCFLVFLYMYERQRLWWCVLPMVTFGHVQLSCRSSFQIAP